MDSLGLRSQDTFETAQLWSPCYDPVQDGARLTFWNDRGSSVQLLRAFETDDTIDLTQVWTQYEVMLSPEFFFQPNGTTSAKLYRIHRVETDACRDERFADNRFLVMSPTEVVIGPVLYCSTSYAGSETGFSLDPTRANHWIRVTAHYDITNGSVSFWGYDVTDDDVISEQHTTTHRGERINFSYSTVNLESLTFTLHSTSHDADPSQDSPHFWFRNVVLSSEPIAP